MLEFEQIKTQYPEFLQGYERAILREYLQYKILQGLFESNFASRISFLGGTALRIVYGNQRFSEDIDLDNFGLDWKDFEELITTAVNQLRLEGFTVEVSQAAKTAFHCMIKIPKILFEQGISPLQEEKMRIQVDTAAQGYVYQPETHILNKFDIFTQIRVTPLPILLSQKIYTAVNRKRAKGRDFYDITFLLAHTHPDYDFLDLKLGVKSPDQLRSWMSGKIEAYDFEALAEEVSKFLINPKEVQRVKMFRAFWQQVGLD